MNRRITNLKSDIRIISHASVGGYEERRGPLGEKFDFCDPSDRFGQDTWELAESEMGKIALNTALTKINISHRDIGLLVAGDLQNQCVASSIGLSGFGIPFIGVYGACSTCTEALMTLSAFMDSSEGYSLGAALTTSHNSAAERQFRMPIEYGGQRAQSAQWTSTAAGAFILSRRDGVDSSYSDCPRVSAFMPGRIIDGATADGSNMGAAMSFAAAESIVSFFKESGESPKEYDYIVTGDLGKVGSKIVKDILRDKLPGAENLHTDCGLLLYDSESQDAHSGASGCGTSASVLSSHFLPLLKERKINKILLLSTGALMNPSSLLQGQNIYGIAPAIKIVSPDSD